MDIDFEYADMHFVLADKAKRSAHIAIMTAGSSTVKAAIQFARKSGKFDEHKTGAADQFSFDLSEWSVTAVDRCIDVVYKRPTRKVDFATWIEMIKLANYLGLKDIDVVIDRSPEKMDATQLIEVAVQLSLGHMVNKIQLGSFTDGEILKAITPRSIADILWVCGNIRFAKMRKKFLTISIMSRTSTSDVDTLLIHLLSFDCKETAALLLKTKVNLSPLSRRFLEYIAGQIEFIQENWSFGGAARTTPFVGKSSFVG